MDSRQNYSLKADTGEYNSAWFQDMCPKTISIDTMVKKPLAGAGEQNKSER